MLSERLLFRAAHPQNVRCENNTPIPQKAIHRRRQGEDEELEWERERCEAAKAAWERAESFHRQSLDVFAVGRGLS
jgi:hypothetical protein